MDAAVIAGLIGLALCVISALLMAWAVWRASTLGDKAQEEIDGWELEDRELVWTDWPAKRSSDYPAPRQTQKWG